MTLFYRFPQTFETGLQGMATCPQLPLSHGTDDLKTEAGGTVSSTSASDVYRATPSPGG